MKKIDTNKPTDTAPKNTVVSFAPPTKAQINYVLKDGINAQVKMDKVTEIIKADFFNRDKTTNASVLTEKLDALLNPENSNVTPKVRANVKSFIRKTIQPTVKNKSCQEALLGDDTGNLTVSFKMVTPEFIENQISAKYPSGKFVDKWTSADLDSYRVVVENKPVKPDVNILEALVKFIEAHELDTSKVVEICGLIDDGATELPKGFLD
tara:strand:+ start:350 stop:976 length:627 start_codon:yes stop_codon:yes gene_type:complete